MVFIGIQLVGAIFGLALLYFAFLNFKRNEFTAKEFAVWSLLGILFALLSLFPDSIYPVAEAINLQRPLDMFIILGFIFLITVIFYVYTVMRTTQKKMEALVRKLALDKRDDRRRKQ